MILQRLLAMILQERSYLASTERSCNFLETLHIRGLWQRNVTNQKSLARIFQKTSISCKSFVISAKILHYLSRSGMKTSKNSATFVWKINQGSSRTKFAHFSLLKSIQFISLTCKLFPIFFHEKSTFLLVLTGK